LKVKSKEMIDHLVTEIKDKLNELKLQLAGMKERLIVEFKVELDEILDQERTTILHLKNCRQVRTGCANVWRTWVK
jgi:hypothetical protein